MGEALPVHLGKLLECGVGGQVQVEGWLASQSMLDIHIRQEQAGIREEHHTTAQVTKFEM